MTDKLNKSELKQVLISQQEEAKSLGKGLFEREASHQLTTMLKSNLIKVVMGPRRCGKSSLCLNALAQKKVAYVNFDDERFFGLDVHDLNRVFLTLQEICTGAEFFLFDEIQNISGWELFVNRLHRNQFNVIVTGSNGKLLAQELATHLTGRQLSLQLFPLHFSEFVKWKKRDSIDQHSIRELLDQYLLSGGFPEVVKGENTGPYLRELFDKVISRDIAERFRVRDSKILKEIAAVLIQHSAQHLSIQKTMQAFKLKSVATTSKYLRYLESVFLIHELKGYSFKLVERSTSPRKIYAGDLGFMTALWTKPTVDLGARLETAIFLDLISRGNEIYYLKQEGVEVDFAIVRDRKICKLIQVSWTIQDAKTRRREVESLARLGRKYSVSDLTIITYQEKEQIKHEDLVIDVISATDYLLQL